MHQKFVLEFPIHHDGSIVRTVLVRRPTAEDIAIAAPGWRPNDPLPENITDAILTVVGLVTDLSKELVDELDIADIERLSELVGGFSNF